MYMYICICIIYMYIDIYSTLLYSNPTEQRLCHRPMAGCLQKPGQTSPLTAEFLIITVYFGSHRSILRCQPTFQRSYLDAFDLAPLGPVAPVELDHLICIPFSTKSLAPPVLLGNVTCTSMVPE